MTPTRIYRWGGAALIVGGAGFLINTVWGDTVYEGFRPSQTQTMPSWGSWGLIAAAALALVLTAIHFAQPSLNPLLADVGFILFFLLSIGLGYRLWAGEQVTTTRAYPAVG